MNKRLTKVLSLILTLVMFLSVTTPAFAWGGGDIGDGWDQEIDEGEVREFDDYDPNAEAEEEMDLFQNFDEENHIQVTVEAPMGSLPSLAEIHTELVPVEDVREAVNEAVEGEPEILLALDISFWLGEDEIEPEKPVRVKITANELEGKTGLTVVHIPEDAEPETMQLITGEDGLGFEVGANEVAFRAESFSVYAVVGEDVIADESRLTINFINPYLGETEADHIIATVYVKNSDKYLENEDDREDAQSYINDIVFDPGLGEGYELGTNMFRGWSIDAADANPQPQPSEEDPDPDPIPYGQTFDRNTRVYTVDDINKYLAEKRIGSIVEGDVLNIYAMIFQTYTVSYFGKSTEVSMGMHTVFAPLAADAEAPYTIEMAYTPDDNFHFFEGWKILTGKENIVSAVLPNGTELLPPYVSISEEQPEGETPVLATVFPNGTKLVIKGNVQFSVSEPEGHWLIFKENGKGATYNAPQFVKNGEVTTQPANATVDWMKRNGYDFKGWFLVKTTIDEHGRAIPEKDGQGNLILLGAFTFGSAISEETVIAAKWEPRENSPYTVIIWQQKVDGNGYDFVRAIPFTGTTNDPINVVKQGDTTSTDVDEDGNPRTTYNVKIGDVEGEEEEIRFRGFHVESYDTQENEVRIAAEGNTVVNVYYDRNIVVINYKLYRQSGQFVPYDGTPDFNDGNTYYCTDPDDPGYVYPIYKNNEGELVYDFTYTEKVYINNINDLATSNNSFNSTVYRITINGTDYRVYYRTSGYGQWATSQWVYCTSDGWNNDRKELTQQIISNNGGVWYEVEKTETRPAHSPYYFEVSTAGFYTVLSVPGRYGATLKSVNWTWPNEYWWYETYEYDYYNSQYVGSGTRTTFLDTFTPLSDNMTIDLYGFSPPSNASRHIYFYQQKADGSGYELINDVPTKADSYGYIGFNLNDKYTGFKCVSWSADGYTYTEVGDLMTQDNNDYYDAYPGTNGYQYARSSANIHIRYDRLAYSISYFDGVYMDGDNNVLKDVDKLSNMGVVENITYGSDISTYGERYLQDGTTPNPNYKIPVHDGYVFEGWYADENCSQLYDFDTMPLGGVKVYAKWRQIQFRVFLHPNVPSSDSTLSWGSDDQSMSFRITEGNLASTPTGTRTGYVFVGWYFDKDFDQVFNSEVVPLTRDNVTEDYNKETDFTDEMNKYGEIVPVGGILDNGQTNTKEPYNSDLQKDRFWITKKLDLYAKWKAILDNADGIHVQYDAVPLPEEGADPHGHGDNAPTDGNRLYEDNSKAIAQPASTALSEDEHFLYWVVQKWVPVEEGSTEGSWQDVIEDGDIIKVYPGDNFFVKAENARITPDPDSPGKNFYVVQLRAQYGKKDGPEPTHITWYSNIYDVAGTQFLTAENQADMTHPSGAQWDDDGGWYFTQEDVQINNAIPIPAFNSYAYTGYQFLGWGRVCDPDSVPGAKADEYITDPQELTEEDLFLKWVANSEEPNGGHYEALVALKPLEKEFFLFGFLNGRDVGCGNDNHNNRGPQFNEDGTLTITFTEDSYVAVKNGDGAWYMTDGFHEGATGGTLYAANLLGGAAENGGTGNKIFVPGGVEVTFSLRENSDGTLYLNYSTAGQSNSVVPLSLRAGEDEPAEGWMPVKYVAADEEKPYHDLYAIWGGEFYVYHSGVDGGAIDTVPITRDNHTYDLTQNLGGTPTREGERPNVLYGGYYLEKGITIPDPVIPEGGSEADAKIPAYDGSNWVWTTPETQIGTAINPIGGRTYYIKEVPADKYLRPYFHYTYHKDTNVISSAWLISDTDDTNYIETGFAIVKANGVAETLVSSLTVKTQSGNNSIKLTAKRVFGAPGYLSYLEVMKGQQIVAPQEGQTLNVFGNNSIVQYWQTPDGLFVTSAVARTFSGVTSGNTVRTDVEASNADAVSQILVKISDYRVG